MTQRVTRCLLAAVLVCPFLCMSAPLPPHPRLLLTPVRLSALQETLPRTPLLSDFATQVQRAAEALVTAPLPERRMVGRRLLHTSRLGLKRVLVLAMSHKVEANPAHLARARETLLALAAFEDWNPSHFLDVAEMTTALAIGYDWLYHDLSEADRVLLRTAIIEKGLRPSLEDHWWITAHHNWNQVCHGGLALGALAVMEEEPELARRILDRSIARLPLAMSPYEPDGAYPEGPTYWAYGTGFNVLFLDALQTALGDDQGLWQRFPGFQNSASYVLHMQGPSGLLFNYSDCGSRLGLEPAVFWFARKTGRPDLLWYQREALKTYAEQGDLQPTKQGNRLLPLLLLWSAGLPDPIPEPPLDWVGRGVTPVAAHRSSWDPQATFVAIKGGSPSANHAHMDIGSFVLDQAGTRWVEDLGMQDYESLESKKINLWDKKQDGVRWTIFRLRPQAHNTLVINDELQRVAGHAPLLAHAPGMSLLDLSPVYEGSLVSAWRGIHLAAADSVLLQDEVRAPEAPTDLRWAFVTSAEVELQGATAVLRLADQTLKVSVLAPSNAVLQVRELDPPPQPYDAPNPGKRLVFFHLALPPQQTERIAVHFGNGTPPDLRALQSWIVPEATRR